MNIWILQHYATPPDTVSGGRHFNFAKLLTQYGHKTTIFASSFNHSTLTEERITNGANYRLEEIEGVRFFWVKTPSYQRNDWKRFLNMIVYSARAYTYGKDFEDRPTIVWASNPHLFSGITGYLLAKRFGAHFIFEVRDLWPQAFVDIGAFKRSSPFILFLRLIERFVYKQAERVILLMGNAVDYMISRGVDPKKIIYLPHGLDLDMFQKAEGKAPARIQSEVVDLRAKGKLIIGYIGAHGVADALDTVLECCRILQDRDQTDFHFILVGHGSEKKRLQESAARLRLRNISFHASIPKASVPATIKLFDVGIVCKKNSPLYKYGTSFIKTFDYMACGVPILWAVNAPDCPVLEAGCGAKVPADAPEDMARQLVLFARMTEQKRRELGLKGLEYVRKNHDNRALAQSLKGILEAL